MELLMGNLRAALLRKGEPAEQAAESEAEEGRRRKGWKELSALAVKALAVLAVSFIAARVSFFYVMYPCGAALLTVLMARGRGGIYALVPVLLGTVSAQGTSPAALGGIVSALACGVLFFLLKNKAVSLTSRALLASGICVVGKTAVSIGLHTFYTYDGFSVLGEGLLVLFFVFIFEGFFSLVEKENPVHPVSANLFILTISGLLFIAGIAPQTMGPVSPLNAAALFIVLLTGYKLGVMEGATAGAAAGLMLFGAANQGPAIMGILACGGMAAGLVRGERRPVAAVCFCAVCLCFGFLKGYPNLYMSVYEPLLASVVFLVMPGTVLEKADHLLAKAGRDDAYYELLEKNRILSVLNEYRETFSYLALVYGPGKDGKRIPGRIGTGSAKNTAGGRRAERSGRSVASYQFAGLACAIDGMMKELRHVEHPILVKEERFKVKLATAGYARCEGISGDSTLCNHIRKGEYLLALADGMGKGEKAAQESNLTLNTLYNLMRAGFEPELALRMINSLLLMKSTEEIFSTVDMGLIDLHTGRLRLFKIGAATTFIKRGDKVEAVKASSLPLGMVEKITVDSIEVSLRKGDQIIMVSDGITEADRGRVCSADLISGRRADGNSISDLAAGVGGADGAVVNHGADARAGETAGTAGMAGTAGTAGTAACRKRYGTAAVSSLWGEAPACGQAAAGGETLVCSGTVCGDGADHSGMGPQRGAGSSSENGSGTGSGSEGDGIRRASAIIDKADGIDFAAALRALEETRVTERFGDGGAKRAAKPESEETTDSCAADIRSADVRSGAVRQPENDHRQTSVYEKELAAEGREITETTAGGERGALTDKEALTERIKIRNFGGQHCPAAATGSGRPDFREEWLKDTIAQIKSTDPQTVSDLILNRAVERCGLKEKDDMTVITVCIS